MPAVLRRDDSLVRPHPDIKLGPFGPFPRAPQRRELDRRWLHYAFLSRDNRLGMVSNVAWLGPAPEIPDAPQRVTSILLLYKRGVGWLSSQWNTETTTPLWSAFRQPHPFSEPGRLELRATAESPAIRFQLQRTSHPCTSQCAAFARDQHFRWQSETGVLAYGDWTFDNEVLRDVPAIGYHERVRGYWSWPELGGWVFGFANDPATTAPGAPPPTAVVFTLIQPPNPPDATAASVMVWRDGHLRRHFPRRNITVAVRGELARDRVVMVPEMAKLFDIPPMAPIPHHLMITGRLGADWIMLDFQSETAARIILPSETGIDPCSVHEVFGPCRIEGAINGRRFDYTTFGIVEFTGGAGGL